MNIRYKIHMLSARSLISFARLENGQYTFQLNTIDTRKCIMRDAADEQDDNALFYQTMCVLKSSNIDPPKSETALSDLQDVIFYVDFNGIFDRDSSPKMMERQKKAEAMFRPEGITLDFGNGAHRYLAFERSGSMSRQAKLSFIRADVHDEVRRRIMLDMEVCNCQLSKLYAYNGLMLSGGVRIDGINLTNPHRVIIVKNETYRTQTKVVSVEGAAVSEAVKKYNRKEEVRDITVLRHDGEGLISKELAKTVDNIFCGKHIHHSFQIRMPYVKGMVHEVNFKDFLKSAGSQYITDIWGVRHPVDKVDMILTQSMFKGYGWLTGNGMDWNDYLSAFEKYNHALYITNVSKVKPDDHTELNYQFLNTLSMTAEEFRPHDLPDGWECSPSNDSREWITKATEQRYFDFCQNEDFRRQYFIDKNNALSKCVKKNPLFANEKACVKELNDIADKLIRQYSLGRLLVKGDNRFLSDDILDLLTFLIDNGAKRKHKERTFWSVAMTERFNKNSFYSPGASYDADAVCTLLRNPHIARNEEIQLKLYGKSSNMRKYYLSQLTDVVMVDPESLAAQRLGGADFDGDMIKTIADNLLNECVKRNYEYDDLNDRSNLPLLYIPSEEPVTRNANDWHDRFVTVRDTFSSRVGQICNAAFDRSIIAYDEKLYMIPLYYSPDVFVTTEETLAKYGLTSKTFSFVDLAKALKNNKMTYSLLGAKDLNTNLFYSFLSCYVDFESGTTAFDSDEFSDTLDYMVEVILNDETDPNTYYFLHENIKSGKSILYKEFPSVYQVFRTYCLLSYLGATPALIYNYNRTNHTCPASVDVSVGINNNSRHKDKALKFIRYCLSDENQMRISEEYGYLPVNNNALTALIEQTNEEIDFNDDGTISESEKTIFHKARNTAIKDYAKAINSIDRCTYQSFYYLSETYYNSSVIGGIVNKYLNGEISKEKFIRQLKSATEIYLTE